MNTRDRPAAATRDPRKPNRDITMKASEVHQMGPEELKVEEQRLRTRLFELKSQAVTQKLENPSQLRGIRRDIARLQTESRQRQLKEKA